MQSNDQTESYKNILLLWVEVSAYLPFFYLYLTLFCTYKTMIEPGSVKKNKKIDYGSVRGGILTSVSKCCLTFGPERGAVDSLCTGRKHFYCSTWIASTRITLQFKLCKESP